MVRRSTPRNPLFDGRWFEDEIIIWCLRWYFRYKLSYRDLVEMMGVEWPWALCARPHRSRRHGWNRRGP